MTRSLRASLASVTLFLALTFSGCGDALDETTPSTPTGSASPNPAATPTPTPTPLATPTQTASCTLPARPDCGASCCSEGGASLFSGLINDAQADLERTRPDIFHSDGSLKLDELEYTDLLALKLMQLNPGLCARGGGRPGESYSKDEVAMKRDNEVSQNVDVIIGSSHTPYIGGRYTCRPASF